MIPNKNVETKELKPDSMSNCISGLLIGFLIAAIIVFIGFWEPVNNYFVDVLCESYCDRNDAFLFVLFSSWVVAAIVGVIVWIVVAIRLERGQRKEIARNQ